MPSQPADRPGQIGRSVRPAPDAPLHLSWYKRPAIWRKFHLGFCPMRLFLGGCWVVVGGEGRRLSVPRHTARSSSVILLLPPARPAASSNVARS